VETFLILLIRECSRDIVGPGQLTQFHWIAGDQCPQLGVFRCVRKSREQRGPGKMSEPNNRVSDSHL
jgi:hypothetical protein